MMRISAMTPGTVFRDPEDSSRISYSKPEESWYQVTISNANRVDAVHLITRSPRKWTRGDCKRLIAASHEPNDEFDLSCYVGRPVRVTLAHGIVTGSVRCINYQTLSTLQGSSKREVKFPVSINLDGETWTIKEVRKLELIED